PLAEVDQPCLYILLLPSKPIILPETLPPLRAVVALSAAVCLVSASLNQLTRCLIKHHAGAPQVVSELKEDVQVLPVDRRHISWRLRGCLPPVRRRCAPAAAPSRRRPRLAGLARAGG